MQQDIEAILRHELQLLRSKSLLGGGLEVADFKKFEVIVRVHKEFTGPSKNKASAAEGTAQEADVSELLEDIGYSIPKPI